MASNRSRFQKDTPRPLRSEYGPAEFTRYQLLALGSFISAMLSVGHGIYANVLQSSGTVRMRIYAEGESWEDNISPRDDFAQLLGGYAAQFKCVTEFQAILGAGHAGAAERAAEAPAAGSEGKDTSPGGAKRLRPS